MQEQQWQQSIQRVERLLELLDGKSRKIHSKTISNDSFYDAYMTHYTHYSGDN